MNSSRQHIPFNLMTPAELSNQCQNKRAEGIHEAFCVELFRRAIDEDCVPCWEDIYENYRKLLYAWIIQRLKAEGSNLSEYTVDELAQNAFTYFWRSYTSDKLARAKGLGHILKYLKACAITAVAQARRKAMRNSLQVDSLQIEIDNPAESEIFSRAGDTRALEAGILQEISAETLWAAVEAACNNEQDLIIARLTLKAALKPRQIVDIHPELFAGIAEVYRLKRNLIKRLRRNLILQTMYEKGLV